MTRHFTSYHVGFFPSKKVPLDNNPNGQFNTLTGALGNRDGRQGGGTASIIFIGDGRQIASFTVDNTTLPTDISVDVSGVVLLRIEISQPFGSWSTDTQVILANAMIQ